MDDWHYPRANLAKHYLNILEMGISSTLALIAPRRKGKTLFILQDLFPIAQKKKYIPVYASLWQNVNSPHDGLISAIEETIAALDKKTTIARLLKSKIKKTTISNDLLGKMEVEFADSPSKPSVKELSYLDKLLTELEIRAGKKQVLLLIDEVQHLSTSSAFNPLTHSLRTMLDKRQGKVKCICTGSSRHYMNLLFNESQSPFYHFVESVPFPDLEQPFIEFIRKKLSDDYQLAVPLNPLRKAFDAFDRSPYWMMKLVAYMITSKSKVDESVAHVILLMEATEGFAQIVNRMKPIDKIVFLALGTGQNPFSKQLMAKIDKETEVRGVQSNVQRSISRLSEANLVSQIKKGEYHIEKPGLSRYLESL
jgi:hypothetical protein